MSNGSAACNVAHTRSLGDTEKHVTRRADAGT